MPTTRDACIDALRALGVVQFPDFEQLEGHGADGPLCAVLDNDGGVQGWWNAAGRADSHWGDGWYAVCTCTGSSCTSDASQTDRQPGSDDAPGKTRERDRGEAQLGPMLMTLPLLLVVIALAIYKFKMKQRRAEMQRQAALASRLAALAPAPVGVQAQPTMLVTVPAGVNPGETVCIATPAGVQMQVVVPPGVVEGGQFQVALPPAPVVVAAIVVPQ